MSVFHNGKLVGLGFCIAMSLLLWKLLKPIKLYQHKNTAECCRTRYLFYCIRWVLRIWVDVGRYSCSGWCWLLLHS